MGKNKRQKFQFKIGGTVYNEGKVTEVTMCLLAFEPMKERFDAYMKMARSYAANKIMFKQILMPVDLHSFMTRLLKKRKLVPQNAQSATVVILINSVHFADIDPHVDCMLPESQALWDDKSVKREDKFELMADIVEKHFTLNILPNVRS